MKKEDSETKKVEEPKGADGLEDSSEIMKEGGDESQDGEFRNENGFEGMGGFGDPYDDDEDEDGRENARLLQTSQDQPNEQQEQEQTEEDKLRVAFERAALSTLFLQVVDKFRSLYANDAAPRHI